MLSIAIWESESVKVYTYYEGVQASIIMLSQQQLPVACEAIRFWQGMPLALGKVLHYFKCS